METQSKFANYQCSFPVRVLTAESYNPTNNRNGKAKMEYCCAFNVFNNTDCTVTFGGMPFLPGGSGCYGEIVGGCYSEDITIAFDNANYTTGFFYVQRSIRFKPE